VTTSGWTQDQLDRLGETQEMLISGGRSDGSPRTPVIVWVVRVGDDLFTRSVNGADAEDEDDNAVDGSLSPPGTPGVI
jgi:hypothetical protein